MKLSFKQTSANLIAYWLAHAILDGVAVALVFTILYSQGLSEIMTTSLLLFYFVLGFGLRPIIGFATDYCKLAKEAALLWCWLVLLATLVYTTLPFLAIIFAWLGNAFFHVWGGSISLNVTPEKAWSPGIFIAPWALGIFFWTAIWTTWQFIAWPAILILIISFVWMVIVKKPDIDYDQNKHKISSDKLFTISLLLILLTTAIYSFVSLIIAFPWKSNYILAMILIISVVLGKSLGWVIGDKYGWIKTWVGGMFLAIFLLAFGAHMPLLAIPWIFLINISVPITTVAISNLLPWRSAFAFGLSSLALVLWAAPAFLGLKTLLDNPVVIFIALSIATIAFYKGLKVMSMKK